jgi:hypothetical protein
VSAIKLKALAPSLSGKDFYSTISPRKSAKDCLKIPSPGNSFIPISEWSAPKKAI